MRTEIHITGQINGNYILRNALSGGEEVREGAFNSQIVVFATKKAAKKALWEAFKDLRRQQIDNYGYNSSMAGVRYSKYGELYYDASKAVIQ